MIIMMIINNNDDNIDNNNKNNNNTNNSNNKMKSFPYFSVCQENSFLLCVCTYYGQQLLSKNLVGCSK